MNCNEFSSHNSMGMPSGRLGSEALMHLEQCQACRRVWHTEQELARRFQELKDSAPTPPQQMEASVMGAYRANFARPVEIRKAPQVLLRTLAWGGVAVLMILGVLVFSRRNTEPTTADLSWKPPLIAAPPIQPQARATEVAARKPRGPHRAKGNSAVPQQPVMEARDPSTGFQNLMYCDALSCSGPMDVIRIEMPAAAVNQAAWRPHNGFVQADVVVGSDGIARAIRIVR